MMHFVRGATKGLSPREIFFTVLISICIGMGINWTISRFQSLETTVQEVQQQQTDIQQTYELLKKQP